MNRNKAGHAEHLAKLCVEAGGLTFARFMHAALWGPGGYYAEQVRIGTAEADFFTAAASPLLGGTLANYCGDAWKKQLDQSRLTLVELGPGEGHLLVHMLTHLLRVVPDFVHLEAVLVEPSAMLQQRQRHSIGKFFDGLPTEDRRRVSAVWMNQVGYVTKEVVLVANEVLDALPVERIRRSSHGFEQGYVVYSDQGFAMEWRPASKQIAAIARKWLPIPRGTTAELSFQLPDFMHAVHGVGHRVKAVLIDYGIHSAEWEAGTRPQGTLRSFRHHQLVDVLSAAGLADITADVHWEFAANAASAAGFQVQPLLSQGSFLLKWNVLDVLHRLQTGSTMGNDAGDADPVFLVNQSPDAGRWTGELKQLILPGGMGERFAVLECVKE